MANNFIQPGHVLDYVNTTGKPVASGDVVVCGNLLGVALVDIAPGAVGSVTLTGVFLLPKVAGVAVQQGEKLVWVASEGAFGGAATTLAAGDMSGAATCFAAAGATDAHVQVKLIGTPGTVAP